MTASYDSVDGWLQYQRSLNAQRMDLGLERLRPVAARMGLRAGPVPVITVAGTNGKGSTVAMLETLARCHGLTSASYTSPWLLRCNESVRVDSEPVDDAVLLDAFARVEAARDAVPLTEFEFRTLAAAVAFARNPDVAILEVGLGGRLDAVNLFDAAVAVVCSIDLDHQQWLGETRAQIAVEKAGIARPGAPLISAEERSNALLAPLARAAGAVPWLAQDGYAFGVCAGATGAGDGNARWWFRGNGLDFASLPMPALGGRHQLSNAAAAILALSLLGGARLEAQPSARAMREVRLAGRTQRLPGDPPRIVDVAHNPHAGAALAQWVIDQGRAPISALCAMYADKDMSGTARAMREAVHTWHLAPLPPPRGASAQQLRDAVARACPGASVHTYDSVAQAWHAACCGVLPGGSALGFGSFETVSTVLRLESAAGRLDT